MVKLNLCWLLFSLPIVTMGASTVAVYRVTLQMIDEKEGYIFREFWKGFKSNLKQGIPLGLILMALGYVIWFCFSNFKPLDNNFLLIAGIVVTFVTILAFIYAFPLSARYSNTLIGTLKNSIFIAVRYFGRTLVLAVVLFFEFYLFLYISEAFFNFFVILFGPGCFMLTISGFAMKFFREIEKEEGAVTNPEVLEQERHE